MVIYISFIIVGCFQYYYFRKNYNIQKEIIEDLKKKIGRSNDWTEYDD